MSENALTPACHNWGFTRTRKKVTGPLLSQSGPDARLGDDRSSAAFLSSVAMLWADTRSRSLNLAHCAQSLSWRTACAAARDTAALQPHLHHQSV